MRWTLLLALVACGNDEQLRSDLEAARAELASATDELEGSRTALAECLAREIERGLDEPGTPSPSAAPPPSTGPAPIVPIRSRVRANSAGTPELEVWMRNDSEKAVDAIRFDVVCFNNFGDVVTSRRRRQQAGFRGSWQAERDRERLQGGQERRLAHWDMFRFDGCTKAKVTVGSVHFVEGDTWAGAAEQEGFPDSAL